MDEHDRATLIKFLLLFRTVIFTPHNHPAALDTPPYGWVFHLRTASGVTEAATMEDHQATTGRIVFGRRKIVPHACIADRKQQVRALISEALQDLGFVTCECAQVGTLGAVLNVYLPDLVIVGLSGGEVEAGEILTTLAGNRFGGMVLLLASGDSPAVGPLAELGQELGLAMLPLLPSPFGSENLRDSVAVLLPRELPEPQIDIAEAVSAGWLELWYQAEVDARTLALRSAEALVRMRHPYWGVIQPAYFVPADGSPHFQILSEFVVDQAIADWHDFFAERKALDISINLSISFLRNAGCFEYLCKRLPNHPAFPGLIVEVDARKIVQDLSLARDLAKELRPHKMAISIDDLGTEWPSLIGLSEFPFVEIKVDGALVRGCADDGQKRKECQLIVELADTYGARTVAEGVETRGDFLAVREIGFDLVQGFLFGKPMTVQKFARTMLHS